MNVNRLIHETNLISAIRSIDWANKERLDEAYKNFQSILIRARNITIDEIHEPNYHLKSRWRRKTKQRLTTEDEELKELYKIKGKFNRLWLQTREYKFREAYNLYRSKTRRAEKDLANRNKNRKIEKINKAFKTNKNKAWRQIEIKENVQVTVESETLINEYTRMFNEKLEESNRSDEASAHNKVLYEKTRNEVGQYPINTQLIKLIIKRLKNNRAQGLSGISNEQVKHGGDTLAESISIMMEKMINFSYIPKEMNIGLIFPIIKDNKGSTTSIDNTRPITLSETLAIIYEKYVMYEIENSYEENDRQFGFKAKSSINHAIFTLRETMVWYKNRGKEIHACFVDFSKAFDKVNRQILLQKLANTLNPHIWASLYNYYEKSTIRIRFTKGTSEAIPTTVGVKQGGPLSPKLFSVYIDNMINKLSELDGGCNIEGVNTSTILYADDTVLLFESKDQLQQAINHLQDYCTDHEIRLNINKTKYFSTRRTSSKETISINGAELETVSKFKYLGWWLEKNLGNQEHLKARKFAALLASYQINKIGFESRTLNVDIKVTLRDTYCRSRMNFALENTYLHQKDYKDLNVTECKILKNALKLKRYHSNTLINNALGITPIERIVKIRKLNFLKELLKYDLTSNIIDNMMDKRKKIPHKSLLKECMAIIGKDCGLQELTDSIAAKISELKEITNREQNSKESKAIKYLLERKCPASIDLARKLLFWANNHTNDEHRNIAA